MSFESELTLELTVPQSEIDAVAQQIENGVGQTAVGADPGAPTASTDGGNGGMGGREARRARREFRWNRQRTDDTAVAVDTLEEIHATEEAIAEEVGGSHSVAATRLGIARQTLKHQKRSADYDRASGEIFEAILETVDDIDDKLDGGGGGILSDVLGIGSGGAAGAAGGLLAGAGSGLATGVGAFAGTALGDVVSDITGEEDPGDIQVEEPEWTPIEVEDHGQINVEQVDEPEWHPLSVDKPDWVPLSVDEPGDGFWPDLPGFTFPDLPGFSFPDPPTAPLADPPTVGFEDPPTIPIEEPDPIDVNVSVEVGLGGGGGGTGAQHTGSESGSAGSRTPVTDDMTIAEAIIEDVPGSNTIRQIFGPIGEDLGGTRARSPQDIAVNERREQRQNGGTQAGSTEVSVSVDTGDTTVNVDTDTSDVVDNALDAYDREQELERQELERRLDRIERQMQSSIS